MIITFTGILAIFLITSFLRIHIFYALLGITFFLAAGLGGAIDKSSLISQLFINHIDSYATLTIIMFAISGELNRVMDTEQKSHRFAQTCFSGYTLSPITAPWLGTILQGLFYLRSGAAITSEVAKDFIAMRPAFVITKTAPNDAWDLASSGGIVALTWPVGYLAIIASFTYEESIRLIMLSMFLPWLTMIAMTLGWIALVSGRHAQTLHCIPRIKGNRLLQIWRDNIGLYTQILASVLAIFCILAGVTTLTEAAVVVLVTTVIAAFFQPIRPRFKDTMAAVTRAGIVTIELVLVVSAASAVLTLVNFLHPELNGHLDSWLQPSIATSIGISVTTIFIFAFFLGIPCAIVLTSPIMAQISTNTSFHLIIITLYVVLLGNLARLLLCKYDIACFSFKHYFRSLALWGTPVIFVILLIAKIPELVLILHQFL